MSNLILLKGSCFQRFGPWENVCQASKDRPWHLTGGYRSPLKVTSHIASKCGSVMNHCGLVWKEDFSSVEKDNSSTRSALADLSCESGISEPPQRDLDAILWPRRPSSQEVPAHCQTYHGLLDLKDPMSGEGQGLGTGKGSPRPLFCWRVVVSRESCFKICPHYLSWIKAAGILELQYISKTFAKKLFF